jgi:hypothetical protein
MNNYFSAGGGGVLLHGKKKVREILIQATHEYELCSLQSHTLCAKAQTFCPPHTLRFVPIYCTTTGESVGSAKLSPLTAKTELKIQYNRRYW